MEKCTVWGSPVCADDFLPITGPLAALEEGAGCREHRPSVRPARLAPLGCLYHFAQSHVITSSSEIAAAQGPAFVDQIWLDNTVLSYPEVRRCAWNM